MNRAEARIDALHAHLHESADAATTLPSRGRRAIPARASTTTVSRLRPLRAVHGVVPHVRRNGQRERQPARPHLSDARRHRRPAGADAAKCARHLELCLDCRACETACPSGVQYGKLIEPFRVAMEQTGDGRAEDRTTGFIAGFCFGLFPYPRRMRAALVPARIAQRLGLDRAAAGDWACCDLLPPRLRQLVDMLPPLEQVAAAAAGVSAGDRPTPGTVALFTGCVADAMFRHTNWATARVLQQNGCDVRRAARPGLLRRDPFSRRLERAGPRVCRREPGGVRLRRRRRDHRQRRRLRRDAQGLRPSLARRRASRPRAASPRKVKDINEFLDELGLMPPQGEIRLDATYHDACHLGHAQKIREAPRQLLAKIPGLKLRRPARNRTLLRRGRHLQPDRAGNVGPAQPPQAGQHPHDRRRVVHHGQRRLPAADRPRSAHAGREAAVVHPMDLLDLSYRKEKLEF